MILCLVWIIESYSAGSGLDLHDSRKLRLPLVTVLNQLLFVVKELLVQECGVLVVGAFDNSVDWAGFLAETAEDALGHVDVVLGSTARAIRTGLRFNGDSESWASGLAKFAGNAALFTGWVTTEGVLTTEHRGERSLFPRVMQDVLLGKKEKIRIIHG